MAILPDFAVILACWRPGADAFILSAAVPVLAGVVYALSAIITTMLPFSKLVEIYLIYCFILLLFPRLIG